MSDTTLTNNEIFEMATELIASAVSQQPGVLSIRSTDTQCHSLGEVTFKQLLVTIGDDRFEEYLAQCQNRRGEYSIDGADDVANTTWTTWTPWSTEDLARLALHVPVASFSYNNDAEFEKFAGELLENHAVLKQVFDLYGLQRETSDIAFVLSPEHPEDFIEKMRAVRIEYLAEDVQFLQCISDEGEPAFTDEDIAYLTELQKGRLFDPTTQKFVNPTN